MMNANLPKYLITEGFSDKHFFRAFLQKISGNNDYNSILELKEELSQEEPTNKNAAIKRFQSHVKNMSDRPINLALVVDADFSDSHAQGFENTLSEIKKILAAEDYELSADANGFTFSSEGKPDIGVWIMPNNKNDGALEDFCLQTAIKTELTEQGLLSQAKEAITNLNPKKFSAHKTAKAEVSTWLAWQENPGQSLGGLCGAHLLDNTNPLYQSLKTWLQTHFFEGKI